MGALAAYLRRRIQAEGPLPLSVFMGEALGHPTLGYYTSRDPLGAAGDFTTSPEISQMFGELLGLWCGQVWLDQGRPGLADSTAPGAPGGVVLAELGPGRGTLMADALRALARVPGLRESATVCLVEISPVLRDRQRRTLAPALAAGWRIRWCDHVDALPAGPLLLLANEFFDALPIRQFQRTARPDAAPVWAERRIGLGEGLDTNPGADGGDFVWLADTRSGDALIPPALRDAPVGSVVELCPAAAAIAATLAGRIGTQGGGALIVDYGYAGPAAGDTLQALAAHRPVPALERPGEVDLTAHVDFTALAEAARARGAAVPALITQAVLLESLGLHQRAAQLRARATPAQALDIDAAAARLTATATATDMGRLFKALAILPPGAPPAPAFPS